MKCIKFEPATTSLRLDQGQQVLCAASQTLIPHWHLTLHSSLLPPKNKIKQ